MGWVVRVGDAVGIDFCSQSGSVFFAVEERFLWLHSNEVIARSNGCVAFLDHYSVNATMVIIKILAGDLREGKQRIDPKLVRAAELQTEE